MRLLLVILGFFILCGSSDTKAQYPSGYGRIMPFELRLAGNFGELRPGHFHAGIDLKTNETEGLPVFSAAAGYVSRVKTSITGYGNAIYITHPDGIVTVYGHLRAFYPAIEDTIRKIQSAQKFLETEFFPEKDFFKVSRQQIIGFSGNSGSSEGPHLHFETRHEKSEKPFNPAFFGYASNDTIAPVIKTICIYSPGIYNGLYGASRKFYAADSLNTNGNPDTLITGNNLFIGFEGYDLAGEETNQLGIRSYRLFMDDSLVFTSRIDSFLFDETRMINSVIDFPYKTDSGKVVSLCLKLPGNKLPFYGSGDGLIKMPNKSIRLFKLVADDFAGNQRTILFYVKSGRSSSRPIKQKGIDVQYEKELDIITSQFQVKISKNSFFEKGKIKTFQVTPDTVISTRFSSALKLDFGGMAIFQPLRVSLKSIAPQSENNKLVVAVNHPSGKITSVNGSFKDGLYTFSTRNEGIYYVVTDTTPPVVMPPSWAEDSYTGSKKLVVPVKQDFSGIRKYECYVNDTWVPGEYNSSRNNITIYLAGRVPAGREFRLRLVLTDYCENTSESSFTLLY